MQNETINSRLKLKEFEARFMNSTQQKFQLTIDATIENFYNSLKKLKNAINDFEKEIQFCKQLNINNSIEIFNYSLKYFTNTIDNYKWEVFYEYLNEMRNQIKTSHLCSKNVIYETICGVLQTNKVKNEKEYNENTAL